MAISKEERERTDLAFKGEFLSLLGASSRENKLQPPHPHAACRLSFYHKRSLMEPQGLRASRASPKAIPAPLQIRELGTARRYTEGKQCGGHLESRSDTTSCSVMCSFAANQPGTRTEPGFSGREMGYDDASLRRGCQPMLTSQRCARELCPQECPLRFL